jgi:hypothetical protein
MTHDDARLIADPGGRAKPQEVLDAHLRAVSLAELIASGRHEAASSLIPTEAADLRLLVDALAVLVADFATIAADPTAPADLFNRLRLRVLTAAQGQA